METAPTQLTRKEIAVGVGAAVAVGATGFATYKWRDTVRKMKLQQQFVVDELGTLNAKLVQIGIMLDNRTRKGGPDKRIRAEIEHATRHTKTLIRQLLNQ